MKKTLLRCFALLTSFVGCAALFGAGYWCGSRDMGWRARDGIRDGLPPCFAAQCAGKGDGRRECTKGLAAVRGAERLLSDAESVLAAGEENLTGKASAADNARAECLARVRAARKFLREFLRENANAPLPGQTPAADTERRLEDARKLLDFQNAPAEFYGIH